MVQDRSSLRECNSSLCTLCCSFLLTRLGRGSITGQPRGRIDEQHLATRVHVHRTCRITAIPVGCCGLEHYTQPAGHGDANPVFGFIMLCLNDTRAGKYGEQARSSKPEEGIFQQDGELLARWSASQYYNSSRAQYSTLQYQHV